MELSQLSELDSHQKNLRVKYLFSVSSSTCSVIQYHSVIGISATVRGRGVVKERGDFEKRRAESADETAA